MSSRVVEVRAPSRLHFGMFGFGPLVERQFGGVGAMIENPCLLLRIAAAERLTAVGPQHERVIEFARRWAAAEPGGREPACLIEVLEAPPPHAGLGSGTQLGLSVAAGLDAWIGRPRRDAPTLAQVVGRGRRSAVGIHGFDRGGLIVEAGKRGSDEIAPLVDRLELPAEWQVMLIVPADGQGLTGEAEQRAFSDLPPVPPDRCAALWNEVGREMLPAVREVDFARFGESVFRFGYLSGECFAPVQGGPYGSSVKDVVVTCRECGFRGVGQSSWGPTVYAWLLKRDAKRLAEALRPLLPLVTAVSNHGATVDVQVPG